MDSWSCDSLTRTATLETHCWTKMVDVNTVDYLDGKAYGMDDVGRSAAVVRHRVRQYDAIHFFFQVDN